MFAQSVVVFVGCVIVDSLFLEPCCSSVKILFLAVFSNVTRHYMFHNLGAYTSK